MSVRSKAKITTKNQLTLPAPVRKSLGVSAGDEVLFEEDIDGIRVRPIRAKKNPFTEFAGKYRIGAGYTLDEVNAFVRGLRGK